MTPSRLERRYRTLLRVLPAWYRAEREEEMVGILLTDRDDDLDLEYGWPGWGEAGATLALAVRVRFGATRRAGRVLRLLALTGLLGQVVAAAQSTTQVVRQGWSGHQPQGWSDAWWFDVMAAVAFAALVSGRRVVGRVAAGVVGLAGLAHLVTTAATGSPPSWTVLVVLPVLVTGAAAVVGFHREAPPVPSRWWATAPLGIAAGVVSVLPAEQLSATTLLTAWAIAVAVVAVVRPWATRRPVPAG